ncbi:polyprenyl synthetase family protein [uncultured Helicobacter sp.]|uniref:polyprenyl synthetase family protein n=1 Tax=uncultured Helicobacter sp. TaxID=175537 RepID=UPI00374E91B8
MQDFDKVRERIVAIIQGFVADCGNEIVTELFAKTNQGKMLRSKLLLAVSGVSEEALKLCAIIELIQSASLLHDDVIDNASTRRKSPSLNAIFGNKNAIMLGDVLYAKAFFELSTYEQSIAKSVSDSVCRLAVGEIEDVFMAQSFNTNKTRYLQMCELKTAALIAASAECGALLSGLDSQKYRSYGNNLGIAFQIIDDVLDITQSTEVLGKPAMSDLSEGKSTLPYIYLYERATREVRQELLTLFGTPLCESKAQWLKEQLNAHHCVQDSIAKAREYALSALDSIQGEGNTQLNEIVQNMIEREF